MAIASPLAAQQIAPPRSLEELKAETVLRAERNAYPLGGLRVDDVREAVSHLDSLDREDWGKAWLPIGDRYIAQAKTLDGEAAKQAYRQAFLYYSVGRFPIPNAESKKKAYQQAIDAFLNIARFEEPKLQVVTIPFEGKEIIAYLRLPSGVTKAPLIIAWGGLDLLKEQVSEACLPFNRRGIASLAIDIPGTGQAPIKASPDADRMFSRVLDYVATRPEIDAKRVFTWGTSWGGYWATKLAITERSRLAGSIDQGGPVDHFFTTEWQMKALGTREYLMDLFAARAALYGAETLDEFLADGRRMSLVALGLVDKPSAPMLLLNGAKDTQVPIADLELLLLHGSAKDAWVNPNAGHVGMALDWTLDRLTAEIVLPWVEHRLAPVN